MGRHAQRPRPDETGRYPWRDRLVLALVVLAASCMGVVWAGGGWRLGLAIGAAAAVVVVGALALGGTMPVRPEPPEDEPDPERRPGALG